MEAKTKTIPCHKCNGTKVVRVSREFSEGDETCWICNGTGEEPERFARLIRVKEAVDGMRNVIGGAKEKIWYNEKNGNVTVVVHMTLLGLFWIEIIDKLGDYRPKLDMSTGDTVWLVFEPKNAD